MADELLDGPLSTRVTSEEKAALLRNAESIGSSKDIVLRELVRAFNQVFADGAKPTFPFEISCPTYRLEGGRVIDVKMPTGVDWGKEIFGKPTEAGWEAAKTLPESIRRAIYPSGNPLKSPQPPRESQEPVSENSGKQLPEQRGRGKGSGPGKKKA